MEENGLEPPHPFDDEDEYQPRTPDETAANNLPFQKLVHRLEKLWQQRNKKDGTRVLSKEEKLSYILPARLRQYLGPTGSPFPLLRLLVPEMDNVRGHLGMKERMIAIAWGEAMGLAKSSPGYTKLLRYTDPEYAGVAACGDLSLCVEEVLADRRSGSGSNLTLKNINDMLDNLNKIRRGQDWLPGVPTEKSTPENQLKKEEECSIIVMGANGEHSVGSSNKVTLGQKQQQRTIWVEQFFHANCSPLEHKWIVRILLQKLDIGLGWSSILGYVHPYALDIHNANKSLSRLCASISDPEWLRRRDARMNMQKRLIEDHQMQMHMPQGTDRATLGHTLFPMLSSRTGFSSLISDMEERHHLFAESLKSSKDEDSKQIASSLALKFPAFICETKLDGERMIVHIQNGKVTMQTRNGNWYSRLYSPSIGPAFRRSIKKYNVDLILDGEMLSWDDTKKEHISFGANRTVAKARREWCQRHGFIDAIDMNLHEGETDLNVEYEASTERSLHSIGESGAKCWLKYVVFDILYCGGIDAKKIFDKISGNAGPIGPSCAGSLLELDAYKRKCILYEIIEPQQSEISVVDSTVICPDGSTVDAKEYFSREVAYTHCCPAMDSVHNLRLHVLQDFLDFNQKIRKGRSDKDVRLQRALAVENHYAMVVEKMCQEGIMVKDLASPYVLGNASRSLGYWRKLKADYEITGHAADIDCVVLGGYFATGNSMSGWMSSFLIGCVDTDLYGEIKYMPVTKVNAGGMKQKQKQQLFELTGYDTTKNNLGKWFKSSEIPEFISSRSFQRSTKGDRDGWKCQKKDLPDLWISPEDSFVLTILAAEIVSSTAMSAGVTLRFPRIHKIRVDGMDGKKPVHESETVESLHRIFVERQTEAAMSSNVQDNAANKVESRFIRSDENVKRKIQKTSYVVVSRSKENNVDSGHTLTSATDDYDAISLKRDLLAIQKKKKLSAYKFN